MDPLIKVAVFGSCVTRDNFNSKFNPGYKDLYECVLLADHVSLVSLMAPPVEFDSPKFADLQPRIQNNLRREFGRHFLDELREARPDYLIMDFWPDMFFGVAQISTGDLITRNNWSTTKTPYFSEVESRWLRLDRTPKEFLDLWKDAADKFFAFMGAELPGTRIIIHRARNVAEWNATDGSVHEFKDWGVRMNKHWDKMDDYVRTTFGFPEIDVLTENQRSFEGHPWKAFGVHYTFDYHQRFLTRLTRFVFEDVVESRGSN
ncbi:DUF6270 domain-containing protein [Glutamicibacter sp.]|uniref:DUF6270 domain-containing protein n=1 Tax=Glutamicibacter sp. TaxID=1931995 RepID=UPI003D6AF4D7